MRLKPQRDPLDYRKHIRKQFLTRTVVSTLILILVGILAVIFRPNIIAAVDVFTPQFTPEPVYIYETAEPTTIVETVVVTVENLITATPPPSTPEPGQEYITVKTGIENGFLNLRTGPGANVYGVLEIVPEGTDLVFYSCSVSPWALVEYEGLIGYVDTSYVEGTPCTPEK